MKYLTLLFFVGIKVANPEQADFYYETWPDVIGGPCSTATDRREGTCYLELKDPTWKRN